ncbi:hypothetical protein OIV83_004962 [Microbotryomycetes sp. JL201]|nr:hypothetical protein OIV83_004962 [Microbotryomycetes sp. JL201]
MRLYGFACMQHEFLPHFAPMIACELPGTGERRGFNANETIVVGAHFDSRGSFGYPTAPGADDDGTGTAVVLAIARSIYEHRLTFSRKVVLALFAGEEQGLLGSAWYAKKLKQDKEDVAFMLQIDMIGYRAAGEPMQMARPDKIGLPEASWLLGNVTNVYVPDLQTRRPGYSVEQISATGKAVYATLLELAGFSFV